VGCLETIANGLYQALISPAIGRPLVINCSLVLDTPSGKETDPDFPFDLIDIDLLEVLCQSFRELVDLLSRETQLLIVAAAGNEARVSDGGSVFRPAARFPAAYGPVIGVGALPKESPAGGTFRKASYSNRSDAPPLEGYATLGGEPGEGKGILGVYISKFPHYYGSEPEPDKSIPLKDIRYLTNFRDPRSQRRGGGVVERSPGRSGGRCAGRFIYSGGPTRDRRYGR
jgi:hypothetical protein